jgi:hypothetical protein
MLYLTFRPAKGSVIVPRLVKCLCVATDTFFILLAAWTIVNMCYPFWGWVNYRSIWVGFFTLVPLYMLIEHLSLRSFMTAEYRYNDMCYSGNGRLKHLGFLFSVWHQSNALILGKYHRKDRLVCRKERSVSLGNEIELGKWLGWPLVLITDTIPLILLAAVFNAGYFLGMSVFVFYLMGSALAMNLLTVSRYPIKMDPWEDEMFFEGKMYPKRHVGIVTCILEGSDGELVLSMIEVALFSHDSKRKWFESAAWTCECCLSMLEPVRLGYYRLCESQSA